MDHYTIAIVVPQALTDAILRDPVLGAAVQGVKPLPRGDTLQFGLQDLAAIVTIAVGALQLGEYLLRFARQLMSAKPPAASVVVRTATSDTVIQIDEFRTAEELAGRLLEAAKPER